MKAKYQIYKVTLHSGEIYIGQHKGDVLTDGYIGSPSGQNGCNSYSLEDIAQIEVLDFANTKKDIDRLEIKHIDYYRKTFGVSSRITNEYKWLLKYFNLGVCLNISGGGTYMNRDEEQKYKDFFKDKLIVQCDMNWNFLEIFDCLDDVMYKTKALKTSEFHKCFNRKRYSAHNSRWLLIEKDKINDLDKIILENKEFYENRANDIYKKKTTEIDAYTVDEIYIGRFDSIKEASIELDIPAPSISMCVLGRYKTTHGYIFKSVSNHKTKKQKIKNVNQYDDNYNYIATYVSIAAAAKAVPGTRVSGISKCCNGKAKTAYGYIWKFADENKINPRTAFDMFDTDFNYLETFKSMSDLIERFGSNSAASVYRCCTGKQIFCNGYIFRYRDSILYKKYEKQCNKRYSEYLKKTKNRMINLYDEYHSFIGLFDTALSVAKYIGLKYAVSVLRCCNGKQKTTMGYYCEYANR